MPCASVQEDYPRAPAIGLSPVQSHKPYNTLSIAAACIRDIYVIKHWNINKMCNIKASEKAGCCQY